MTNWQRGFFRLWMLLTILWVIGGAFIVSDGILNPYIPETLFTFNKDDQLEVVPLHGDKHSKMLSDETAGYYTRVGFKDDAPRLFYMAPNAFQIMIRGKKFEAVMSNERLNNPDRESLVTTLLSFINQRLNLVPPVSVEEVRAAMPDVIELQYQGPEVKEQVRQFAIDAQARAADEARRSAIVWSAYGIIIPPLVVLILGVALAWVLKGFRRDRAIAP